MTLSQIISIIKKIALDQPNIHSFCGEFLDLNSIDAKYSAIVLQQRNHQRNNDFIQFNFYLGMGDRLTENKDNEIEVQSTAIQVIDNIVYALENHNLDCTIGSYSVFTERFLALVAGAYTELSINIPASQCEDDFSKEELNVNIVANGEYNYIPTGLGFSSVHLNVDVAKLQDKALNITKNGSYNVRFDKGYSGLGNVDVNVDVDTQSYYDQGYSAGKTEGKTEGIIEGQELQKSKLTDINIIENNTTYTNEDGYRTVSVNIDTQGVYDQGVEAGTAIGIQQQKDKLTDISITENGTYTREDGYKSVEVNVPVNNQEKSITISENGETSVVPDENYTGLSKVSITTDVHPKDRLERTYTENGVYEINGEYAGGEITVAVPSDQKPEVELAKTLTENGAYVFTPDDGTVYNKVNITTDIHPTERLERTYVENNTYIIEGEYNGGEITVNVDTQDYYNQGYANGKTDGKAEGIQEQKDKLTDISITANGTYTREDGYKSVVVNVPSSGGDDSLRYSPWSGSVDETGLNDLYWDFVSEGEYSKISDKPIKRFQANVWWHNWQDDDFKVSDYDKSLSELNEYTDDDQMTYPKWKRVDPSDPVVRFKNCAKLLAIPEYGCTGVKDFSKMFTNCPSLKYVSKIDTSSGLNFKSMFKDCTSLIDIPLLDFSKGTDFSFMFEGCSSLNTVPLFDFSAVSNFSYMFGLCTGLTNIPLFDTGEGTNFSGMFYGCSSLSSIPKLNTTKGTDFSYMCKDCISLKSFNTGSLKQGINFSYMFENCSSLTTVGRILTPAGTDFSFMFENCSSLTTLNGVSVSNGTNFNRMFHNCTALTNITFTDSINASIDFDDCTDITDISIKSILTACSKTTNTNSKTVSFPEKTIAPSDELATLITTCTSKGWTVSGLTISA